MRSVIQTKGDYVKEKAKFGKQKSLFFNQDKAISHRNCIAFGKNLSIFHRIRPR